MGSCVDNSRILEAATKVVLEGGLGDDLSDVPAAGVAPEWMSEKAIAIGCYFVASGVDVILGHPLPRRGQRECHPLLCEETEGITGGRSSGSPTRCQAAEKIMENIEKKRERWASTARRNASSSI